MNQKEFSVTAKENGAGRYVVIPIKGEPEIEGLKRILNAALDLLSRGYGNIIVDLFGVASLSPACAGYLAVMKGRLEAAGGELRLLVRSAKMRQLLAMHGLTDCILMEAGAIAH